MATQSQKIEAAHKLMLDPNTKLTDEYLNSIKLSMLSGYSCFSFKSLFKQ